jgi:hypothetical protein
MTSSFGEVVQAMRRALEQPAISPNGLERLLAKANDLEKLFPQTRIRRRILSNLRADILVRLHGAVPRRLAKHVAPLPTAEVVVRSQPEHAAARPPASISYADKASQPLNWAKPSSAGDNAYHQRAYVGVESDPQCLTIDVFIPAGLYPHPMLTIGFTMRATPMARHEETRATALDTKTVRTASRACLAKLKYPSASVIVEHVDGLLKRDRRQIDQLLQSRADLTVGELKRRARLRQNSSDYGQPGDKGPNFGAPGPVTRSGAGGTATSRAARDPRRSRSRARRG